MLPLAGVLPSAAPPASEGCGACARGHVWMRTTNERVWAGLQNNAINLRIIEIEARGVVATCAHPSVLGVQGTGCARPSLSLGTRVYATATTPRRPRHNLLPTSK